MTCQYEVCQNSILDPGEQCDDGNADAGDGCSFFCNFEVCQNGYLDPGEQCDDGNNETGDGCGPTCLYEVCQNGYLDPSEDCDDGNADVGDGCGYYCQFEVCQNGYLDPGESCDDGNSFNNDSCLNNCEYAICPDGFVYEEFEQCDDNNSIDGDGCTSSCQFEYCGDFIVNNNETEECDDGNTNNSDSCPETCQDAYCGDGFLLDNVEECDDSNNLDNDGCDYVCVIEYCGDGTQQSSEACDDGNNDDNDGCDSQCIVEFCGDYSINNDGAEQCDNGLGNTNDSCNPGYESSCQVCSTTCTNLTFNGVFCGDQIKNGPEDCDGTAGVGLHQSCSGSCTLTNLTYCGDGAVQNPNEENVSEQCDDGNTDDEDTCSNSCITLFCNDSDNGIFPFIGGNVTSNNGTQVDNCAGVSNNLQEFYCDGTQPKLDVVKCEDYDAICVSSPGGDYCSCPEEKVFNGTSCVDPVCGDGDVNQESEACDDGNTLNDDGCSSTCQVEICGDNITQTNESCDYGQDNGAICSPDYGSSCNYCTESCELEEIQGEYCGDDQVNGDEECDGSAPDNYVCESDCTLTYIPFCGDGNIDSNEECDDAGSNGNVCTPDYGTSCSYCSSSCTNETEQGNVCGDGEIYAQYEECDDGAENGNACTPDYGVACSYCTEQCNLVPVEAPVCGDGEVNGPEECDGDDGVGIGQACNENCMLEENPFCGDGNLDDDEACDDSNNENGDGCDEFCEIEEEVPIPEFSSIAGGLAIAGAGIGYMFLRRRK